MNKLYHNTKQSFFIIPFFISTFSIPHISPHSFAQELKDTSHQSEFIQDQVEDDPSSPPCEGMERGVVIKSSDILFGLDQLPRNTETPVVKTTATPRRILGNMRHNN